MNDLKKIQKHINHIKSLGKSVKEISDGYHSFEELYDYRKAYNALLFNEWAKENKFEKKQREAVKQEGFDVAAFKPKYDVHKSKCHFDGQPCFGGTYFVVVAILPTGQITNHYDLKYWDDFKIPEEPKAKYEYDGHTSEEALRRMKLLIKKQ